MNLESEHPVQPRFVAKPSMPNKCHFLAGAGAVRKLLQSHDWSAFPLGAPQSWPSPLKAAVQMMLDCSQPACLIWGDELRCFYNDAYIALAGARHPAALTLGLRDAWPELAPELGQAVQRALAGEAWAHDTSPVRIEGADQTEWRRYRYSFLPVRDDEGGVAGVFGTVIELAGQGAAEPDQAREQAPVEFLGAQTALRCLAEKYRTLLNAMDEGFCVLQLIFDSEGRPADARYIETNPAFERQTGIEQPAGKTIRESAPDTAPCWLDICSKAVLGREHVRLKEQTTSAGRCFDVSAFPIGAVEERVVALLLRDVSARRRTEEALRAAEESLNIALDAARMGTWEVDLLHRRPARRNLRHAQIFGYDTEPPEWGPEIVRDHVVEDDRPIYDAAVARGLETGSLEFEVRVRWPDGSIHWVCCSGRFYRDETGRPVRAAGVNFDTTPQKRVEAALRESEQRALASAREAELERRRLDALLEAAPVGIMYADVNGRPVLLNSEMRRVRGEPQAPEYQGGFVAWKGWWADGSEKHGRPLAPLEWSVPRALQGEEVPGDIVEIEPLGMPGVRRTVLLRTVPVRQADGHIIGAVVAQMDITERIKAEEGLRQADKRKDEFLAMLAHELRNPLAPIGAAADLLALGHLDKIRVRQTSAVISRQVKHMTGLVDDLLDVSRVTRGMVTLNKARLDAKRIVADAVEQARPAIEARGHRLAVHTPPEPAFVLGDQKRLVQVMANLLNNAAKYTPEGGEIVLSMEVDGGQVRMTVADTGIGMEAELVARAFELFAQAERTSDRSQGGLGIGLALVKSLMELHGGSVNAYSSGLGKGSSFTVTLPQLQQHGEMSDSEQKSSGSNALVKALKIMVVDDNADAAQMLAMLVEAMGHQVFIEHSPGKAIERARVERPDVCLLDIGLPAMDGNELARRLRAQAETAPALLVAVTGYGQEQDRKTALDAGFDHHFVKPVDSVQLAGLLGAVEQFNRR